MRRSIRRTVVACLVATITLLSGADVWCAASCVEPAAADAAVSACHDKDADTAARVAAPSHDCRDHALIVFTSAGSVKPGHRVAPVVITLPFDLRLSRPALSATAPRAADTGPPVSSTRRAVLRL